MPNISKERGKKKVSNKKKIKINESPVKSINKDDTSMIVMDNIQMSNILSDVEKVYKSYIGKGITTDERNKLVENSKDYILKTCNAVDYSVFFTNGEEDSNIIFLCSAINAYKKIRKIKPHVIISSVEHESIATYINSLKDSDQIEVTFIKPNIYGCVLSEYISKIIKPNTCCVSITHINHELGSVNNIEKISKFLHDKKIPLHSDCTYLFGKHKLDLEKINTDAITISFDKINGPLGIGAIIIRNNLLNGYKLSEHSLTLENKQIPNIPLIMAAIESVKLCLSNRSNKNKKLLKTRNNIINKLSKKYQMISYTDYLNLDSPPLENNKSKNKLIILGPPINNESYYTPSILSVILLNIKNKSNTIIKKELEKKNIILGIPDPKYSYVFDEIKIPKDIQQYILRISISDNLTHTNIDKFVSALGKII
jgi:cysteine sulfinate desulfinase/cysteine desulfurase-like protein